MDLVEVVFEWDGSASTTQVRIEDSFVHWTKYCSSDFVHWTKYCSSARFVECRGCSTALQYCGTPCWYSVGLRDTRRCDVNETVRGMGIITSFLQEFPMPRREVRGLRA